MSSAAVDGEGADAATARRNLFVRRLPKVELHAHLNGSIRRSTLRELAATKGVDPDHALILSKTPRTLSDCFDVFRVIHACVTTLRDVSRLAYELGQDLEEDGVVYAEIRTTPRVLKDNGNGALDHYVRAVLYGFSRYMEGYTGYEDANPHTHSRPDPNLRRSDRVVMRLILSIDRGKHTSTQAHQIVALAHKFRPYGVVGIDLSGDPTKGNWADYEPALLRARALGLKIALHAGEVRGRDDEMSRMLDFLPHRFGHCCFVSPSNLERLRSSGVPIELCLTSNLLSNSVAELKDHHFGLHYARVDSREEPHLTTGTVCCISTDDSGVFGSPLSNEYRLIMDTFKLSEQQTFHLARRTLQAMFLEPLRADESVPLARGSYAQFEWERRLQDQADLETIQAKFDAFWQAWLETQ